jgi:hypothetical protein
MLQGTRLADDCTDMLLLGDSKAIIIDQVFVDMSAAANAAAAAVTRP